MHAVPSHCLSPRPTPVRRSRPKAARSTGVEIDQAPVAGDVRTVLRGRAVLEIAVRQAQARHQLAGQGLHDHGCFLTDGHQPGSTAHDREVSFAASGHYPVAPSRTHSSPTKRPATTSTTSSPHPGPGSCRAGRKAECRRSRTRLRRQPPRSYAHGPRSWRPPRRTGPARGPRRCWAGRSVPGPGGGHRHRDQASGQRNRRSERSTRETYSCNPTIPGTVSPSGGPGPGNSALAPRRHQAQGWTLKRPGECTAPASIPRSARRG